MDIMQATFVRAARLAGALGTSIVGISSGACDIDDTPACPGQCFAYTVEYVSPKRCLDGAGGFLKISFTGTDPAGYRGRACFNSTSVPLVVQAIDHLRAGGVLSELDPEIQSAYVTTANTVRADLEAECITAAPGQCTNAAEVCSVVGSDAYEQLVIDETCVLELDGTEPVPLGPGEVCEPLAADGGTGSDGSEAHCIETTVTTTDGVDGTASSDEADETSG